jgi:hypothetical protein
LTVASLPNNKPNDRDPNGVEKSFAARVNAQQQQVPGAFLLLLAIYVVFTGTLPTVIQGLAFGVTGGSGSEFVVAMVSGVAYDLLLLVPIIVFANHALGILHPLVLAVLLWPILIHMPGVFQDWGGWAGVLAGSPVETPRLLGLPGHSASSIWGGIAKLNLIQILALASTYAGFWSYPGKRSLPPRLPSSINPASVKPVLMALIVVSLIVLMYFVRERGGLNEHLTSLGRGRFNELSGDGVVLLIVDIGSTALMIWIAAVPRDIKSPIFLACLAAVAAGQFIGNGSRGGALEIPLLVGLVWAMRRRKIPWKIALALIPFMFISIGFMGAIRTSSWTGGTAAQAVQSSTLTQSFERAEDEVVARAVASSNVPVVVRGFEITGGPLLGRSYAVVVTAFIPRPLWPTKPRGVGQLYARVFFGASFSGTAMPVSPPAEMYWNFGFPGVIFLSFLYGLVIAFSYQFFARRYPDPFITVAYVFFITSFQFSSDRLVGLEQRLFLVLLCYFLVAMFVPREAAALGPRRAAAIGRRRDVTPDHRAAAPRLN